MRFIFFKNKRNREEGRGAGVGGNGRGTGMGMGPCGRGLGRRWGRNIGECSVGGPGLGRGNSCGLGRNRRG